MSTSTVHISHLENIEWVSRLVCDYNASGSNHIWQTNINSNLQHINSLWNLLSADEQERADRYYRQNDKQRFIVARATLRILLGNYLKADTNQIIFEIGDNKKPHVRGSSSIHYNVSHSGNYVLIAISDSDTGVDVEQPDSNMHYEDIMNMSYSKQEADFVKRSSSSLQAFYLLWTRKEALLKATGKGIDDAFKFIPSIDGSHATAFNTIGSEKNWIVQSFKIDDNHLGSSASPYSKSSFWEFKL